MSKDSTPNEVKIRGSALKLSVTFEGALMSIVYSCSGELYTDINKAPLLKLKGCMFHQKINRVKELLGIYHPDLLEKYQPLFNDLSIFKDFRNRMAHCGISWGDGLTEFEVWDIAEDENKFQFYQPIKYVVHEVYFTMAKAANDITPPLTNLLHEVQLRLQTSSPKIFAALKLGGNSPEAN